MGQLDNKVAPVIGATSGIGRATATRFIARPLEDCEG
jgi:NAD(P)-dependent dehydrogenase (short-subunit alcohol dehydrogenase family)